MDGGRSGPVAPVSLPSPAAEKGRVRPAGSAKRPRNAAATPVRRKRSRGKVESNVRVAVRVRPMNEREQGTGSSAVLSMPMGDMLQVDDGSVRPKSFTFDHVFPLDASQATVYEYAKGSLKDLLNGFNVTLVAYGQTGSGKTFTMGSEASRSQDPADRGIIPRALDDLFAALRPLQEDGAHVRTTVSFIEVYGNDVYDLLFPDKGGGTEARGGATPVQAPPTPTSSRLMRLLRASSTPQPVSAKQAQLVAVAQGEDGAAYCKGLNRVPISSAEEALKLLATGTAQRVVGETRMNAVSSRSHAIFSVELESERVEPGPPGAGPAEPLSPTRRRTKATLTFVDLAGSERLDRTGATGRRAKEGRDINMGLLCLGNVINALADEARLQKGGASGHVPYRSHKLTRLLQNALGGNSKTIFIACASPASCNAAETLSTLQYAHRARNIRNRATQQVDFQLAEAPPKESAPKDRAPKDSAPKDSAPKDGAPRNRLAEQMAKHRARMSMSSRTTPRRSASHRPLREHSENVGTAKGDNVDGVADAAKRPSAPPAAMTPRRRARTSREGELQAQIGALKRERDDAAAEAAAARQALEAAERQVAELRSAQETAEEGTRAAQRKALALEAAARASVERLEALAASNATLKEDKAIAEAAFRDATKDKAIAEAAYRDTTEAMEDAERRAALAEDAAEAAHRQVAEAEKAAEASRRQAAEEARAPAEQPADPQATAHHAEERQSAEEERRALQERCEGLASALAASQRDAERHAMAVADLERAVLERDEGIAAADERLRLALSEREELERRAEEAAAAGRAKVEALEHAKEELEHATEALTAKVAALEAENAQLRREGSAPPARGTPQDGKRVQSMARLNQVMTEWRTPGKLNGGGFFGSARVEPARPFPLAMPTEWGNPKSAQKSPQPGSAAASDAGAGSENVAPNVAGAAGAAPERKESWNEETGDLPPALF